ncbi:CopG family transcriptional regulator [Bacillus mycoides]|uniref:CopG family transcriptional regulator n=1 Tax=Bacillus mycoides TaxID=1405 RepID=UPI003D65B25B
MKVEGLIKSLKVNNAKVVGKEIGICDKRLLRGLKKAGYEYSKKSGIGWHFTGQGEPPLKMDIREFISAATKSEVNTIMQQKEKVSAQKNINPIHSLYMRIGESGTKEKASRTVKLDKGVWARLGDVEDKYRLNRDEIVEIALYEFFEKYKV